MEHNYQTISSTISHQTYELRGGIAFEAIPQHAAIIAVAPRGSESKVYYTTMLFNTDAVGQMLDTHYPTLIQALDLISHGVIRHLGPCVGKVHDQRTMPEEERFAQVTYLFRDCDYPATLGGPASARSMAHLFEIYTQARHVLPCIYVFMADDRWYTSLQRESRQAMTPQHLLPVADVIT